MDMNMESKLDFTSIKKLTNEGSYCVNVPLESLAETIDRYIEKYDLQLNPDFQRGHVWTETQQSAFVEYVLKGGQVQPIRFNHTSWMSFRPGSEMVCVDGLQRITALLKFMNNELPVFGGYKKDQIDNLKIWNYDIQVNINNLKTRKEVLQWYIDLNTGGTVHTDDEINKVKDLLEKAQ